MEIENNQIENSFVTEQTEIHKLYSKKAIWGFSIFFSSLVGGILLMQNLIEIGKKKEAKTVLIASIVITILPFMLAKLMEKEISTYTLLTNIIGGLIISEFYFSLYIPKEEVFENKKIWKPLLISLLIIVPLIVITIYYT